MYEIRCWTAPQINYMMPESHGWFCWEMFLQDSDFKKCSVKYHNESHLFFS